MEVYGDHCASPPLYCFHLLALKIGIFRRRSSVEESACIEEMGLSNGLLDRESFIAL